MLQDLRRPELVSSMNNVDLLCMPAQLQGISDSSVTSPNYRRLPIAEEEAITGGAVGNTVA